MKTELTPKRVAIIDGTQHYRCAMCGVQDELRPYGPNGESICFDCAMKDEATTSRQFAKLLSENDLVIIK